MGDAPQIDPLEKLLGELQSNRPPKASDHVAAARALVERAEREFPDSRRVVCVHDEWLGALSNLDPYGHAPTIVETATRLLTREEVTGQCRTCLLGSRLEAHIARGDVAQARADVEAMKAVCKESRAFWSVRKEAYALWLEALLATSQGDLAWASATVERHDAMQRHVLKIIEGWAEETPSYRQEPWFHSVTRNALESIEEARLMLLIVQKRHLEALAGVERYLREMGDGGMGMTRILRALAARAEADGAHEALLELSGVVLGEFERRRARRWQAELLLGVARANLALGDRKAARVALFKIDDIRDELVEDAKLLDDIRGLEAQMA